MIRMQNALNARRAALREGDRGFTLIELLVVVIIIGILAAIAIPIYIGVQDNAKDSAVKSDIANAKIAVVAFYTEKNAYPTATEFSAGLPTYGYTVPVAAGYTASKLPALTSGTGATASKFCINATSITGKVFSTNESGSIITGPCTVA